MFQTHIKPHMSVVMCLLRLHQGYEEHKRAPSPPLPCRDWDFRSDLDHDIGFHNPASVRNLFQSVGIDHNNTKSLFSSTRK